MNGEDRSSEGGPEKRGDNSRAFIEWFLQVEETVELDLADTRVTKAAFVHAKGEHNGANGLKRAAI